MYGTFAPIARFEVAEGSMEPALRPGDYLVTRRSGNIRRGDVVVFTHPHRPGFWLVKRVVGLPAETVAVEGGRVSVDGAVLDEPWTVDDTEPPGVWRVEEGAAFVLSDARHRTLADSRTFGPVPISGLRTVVFRYWPLARVGRPAVGSIR